MNDKNIIKHINECFNESKNSFSALRQAMGEDHDFYNSKQWKSGDLRKFQERGAIPITINVIKKHVDVMVGLRIQSSPDLRAFPVEGGDEYIGEVLTAMLKWIWDSENVPYKSNYAYKDVLIGGLGWLHTYIDFDNDYVSGDIKVSNESPFNIYPDPHFTNIDLSDCGYIIRFKQVDKDVLKNIYPEYASDISLEVKTGDTSDTKFNNISNDRGKIITVKEFWHKDSELKTYVLDRYNPTRKKRWTGTSEELGDFLFQNPDYVAIEKMEEVIKLSTLIGKNTLIDTIENPYCSNNKFPFFPAFGFYDYTEEDWEEKVSGIVRSLKDPQREKNARRSAMMKTTQKMPLGGYIADKGSIDDINPYRNAGGEVTFLFKKPGREVKQMSQPSLPASEVQLEGMFSNDINSVGINPDMLGMIDSRSESGKVIQLRQKQGFAGVAEIGNNFNMMQKAIGLQIIDMMLEHFEDAKFKRILGQDIELDSERLKEAREGVRYDIDVDEVGNSPTYRHATFAKLMEMQQYGVQVPFDLLIDFADIPNKAKQKARENYNQQQAMIQAQQQQQQLATQTQAQLPAGVQ